MNAQIRETLLVLETAPMELGKYIREAGRYERDLAEFKRTHLAAVNEALEWAVTEATMEAYADPDVCDGKNQTQRDVQLRAYLGRYEGVAEATRAVRAAEANAARIDAAMQVAQAQVKVQSYRLRAAMAAAELQAALLNAKIESKEDRDA